MNESHSHESVVIGMMLNNEENIHAVMAAGISKQHFFEDSNREIFDAIIRRLALNLPISMVDIAMALPNLSLEIAVMSERAPIAQNIKFYIEKLRSDRRMRLAKDAARRLAATDSVESFEYLAGLMADALQVELDIDDGVQAPAQWLWATVQYMEDAHARHAEGRKVGLQTNVAVFNAATGGLRPKALYVIGARPGCGKTTLGLNFALSTALDGSKPIYFTNEMDEAQLGTKLISNLARVDSYRIDTGDFTDDHIDRIHHATEQLHKTNLRIDSTTRGNFAVLKAKVERAHRKGLCDSVYIDYVQQYSIPGRWQTRAQELEEICRQAKDMAMTLGIPVVIMAQINRGGDDEPRTKDLKDSGGIEQYADVIVLLSRDKDSKDNDNPVRLNFTIGKNRYGSTRKAWVNADLSTSRFLST